VTTTDPSKQRIEVKLPTFERNPRQSFTMPRGARRGVAETSSTWVNCEALPSVPKPVRKYESNEDLDKSEESDLSSSTSSGLANPVAPASTRPRVKPPVPKRSYSVVEKSFRKN
jgi:hypothetical protein